MDSDDPFRERAPIVAGGRVGVEPDEFESIRRAVDAGEDWYVAAMVHHDDRIAFVKNRWSDGWVLPGGGIENGETMAAAVEREVREETGLGVDRCRPLAAVEQTFETTAGDAPADVATDVATDVTGAASVTAYMAVFEVAASGSTFGGDLGDDPDEIEAAAWFESLPGRIDGLSRDLLGALVTESSLGWRSVARR